MSEFVDGIFSGNVSCNSLLVRDGATFVGLVQATGQQSQPFVTPTQIQTFNARITGSDALGDGSLANPFRTFVYTVLFARLFTPPGVRVVLDITGITEVLPIDYTLPAFKGPVVNERSNAPPPPVFLFNAAISIQADTRLVSTLSVADATIAPADIVSQVAQVGSGFILLTIAVARASWGANALRGKIIQGANGLAHTTIVDSTTTTLLLATNAALTGTLTLTEPSAHLISSTSEPNTAQGGFRIRNCDSIALNGIKVTTTTALAFGLEISGYGSYSCQLCELESPWLQTTALETSRPNRCWIYGSRFRLAGAYSFQASVVDGTSGLTMTLLQFAALGPVVGNWRRLAILGKVGATMTPIMAASEFPGQGTMAGIATAAPPALFTGLNVLIRGIPGATGDGFRFHGGRAQLRDWDIQGCGRDAIRCESGSGFMNLENVRTTVANGVVTATGAGLYVTDGILCRVDTATATAAAGTQLRGAVTELRVGVLPDRTWANFTGFAPVGNEFDLVGQNLGATDQSTGSRVYLGPAATP